MCQGQNIRQQCIKPMTIYCPIFIVSVLVFNRAEISGLPGIRVLLPTKNWSKDPGKNNQKSFSPVCADCSLVHTELLVP